MIYFNNMSQVELKHKENTAFKKGNSRMIAYYIIPKYHKSLFQHMNENF